MPFDARRVTAALLKKGFRARQNDHTFYHLTIDGKDAGVFTKISHGERQIGDPLAKHMQKQMKLSTMNEFRNFVDCPMSYEEYLANLKKAGFL